jgi:hypothetical protein
LHQHDQHAFLGTHVHRKEFPARATLLRISGHTIDVASSQGNSDEADKTAKLCGNFDLWELNALRMR